MSGHSRRAIRLSAAIRCLRSQAMSSMGPACRGASTLNSDEAEHTVALFRPIGDAQSGYLPAITSRCPPRSDGSG